MNVVWIQMSEVAMRSTVTRAVIVAALAAGCGASPTVPDQTITQLRAAPTQGPQWGPGVSVDVVAQIRGGSGMVRLVRAADQLILGTF